MTKMIAVCGLDCTACDGYQATKANDDAMKEQAAARWRVEYSNPKVDAAYVTCDGCLSGGRLGGHCLECSVRICGVARGVTSCGLCDEYEGCATIADFVAYVPHVKPTLDAIRAARP